MHTAAGFGVKIRALHGWDLAPKEAMALQTQSCARARTEGRTFAPCQGGVPGPVDFEPARSTMQ